MPNIFNKSTLEFYNYGESNMMRPIIGSGYKVKVSDKDGNIITIEKDDALYACVSLSFNNKSGILSLLDVAHDNSVLAEVEMPNADYIYNCRFDEALNAILFDVKSLYGSHTDTIELDVESLVELYEAGQGIEIGEKSEETGRKPISVKLAEGEELLKLSDDGLGIDDKVVTDDELEAAISGKADIEYVNELITGISGITGDISSIYETLSGLTDDVDKIMDIIGTEEDDPNLDERIDSKADLEEFNDLEEEVGEIEANVNSLSGDVESLKEELESEIDRSVSADADLNASLEDEIESRKADAVAGVEYDSSAKTISFLNANNEVIGTIDTTDFVKDGMVDSVEIETIDNTTYLVITWNTDSGKEVTRIDIGDLFDADNYYTKPEIDEKVTALQEMDAALANVDTQQWAVINQNRTDMETVDGQLWAAIASEVDNRTAADTDLWTALENEITARTAADANLQDSINNEIEERENADESLLEDLNAEKSRALLAESNLQSQITGEIQRAQREEARLEEKHDEDVAELKQADRVLKQYVMDQDADINRRIDGVIRDLGEYSDASIERDRELSAQVRDIRDTYATIEYVDTQDEHVKDAAIQTSTGYAKSYTDTEVDATETRLRQYCDDGHAELQNAINENATKINEITNDSNNGVLDVLHNEFHMLTEGITAAQMVGLLADMLRRIEALENQ